MAGTELTRNINLSHINRRCEFMQLTFRRWAHRILINFYIGTLSLLIRGGSRGDGAGGAQPPSWDEAFFFVLALKFVYLTGQWRHSLRCTPSWEKSWMVTSFFRSAPPPNKNPGSAPVFNFTISFNALLYRRSRLLTHALVFSFSVITMLAQYDLDHHSGHGRPKLFKNYRSIIL